MVLHRNMTPWLKYGCPLFLVERWHWQLQDICIRMSFCAIFYADKIDNEVSAKF